VLNFDARDRESYVTIPAGVEQELPAGLSLELMLMEIQQSLRRTAFPFSISPHRFDPPLDEALAVVHLCDQGFSDDAAWWLAREASITNCVAEIPEEEDEA